MRFGVRSNNSIKDGEEGKWLPFIRTVKLVSLPGSVACESAGLEPKELQCGVPRILQLTVQEEVQPPFCRLAVGCGVGMEGRESEHCEYHELPRPGRLCEPPLLSSAAFRDSKKRTTSSRLLFKTDV